MIRQGGWYWYLSGEEAKLEKHMALACCSLMQWWRPIFMRVIYMNGWILYNWAPYREAFV